jgi:hypothetical protein
VRDGAAITTTIDNHTVDEAMDAYVKWRELCAMVRETYDRWRRAPRAGAAVAFLEYRIALDREERSSLEYAELIRCLAR